MLLNPQMLTDTSRPRKRSNRFTRHAARWSTIHTKVTPAIAAMIQTGNGSNWKKVRNTGTAIRPKKMIRRMNAAKRGVLLPWYGEPPTNHLSGGWAKSISTSPEKTKKKVRAVWA